MFSCCIILSAIVCPKYWGILEIDYDCREELKRFIHQYEVSVLLTGHVHTAGLKLDWINLDGKNWPYLEARCGTSAGVEEFPATWLPAVGQRKPFERNTLLVHRVVERLDGVYWEANAFRRSPLAQQGFADAALPPAAVQQPIYPREIKVL